MEDGSSAKGESTSPLLVHDDRLGNEGLIPQFFPSVPALNEAATYISQTTSYLGRCFSNFVEEAEDDSMNAQELVALSPRQTKGLPSNNHQSTSGSFFTSLEPAAATCIASPMHDRGAKSSTGDSSQKEAEDHNMNAQELVALSPRQTKGLPSNNHQSTSGSFFTSLEPPAATCIAPPMHDRGAKSSTGDSSQSTNEQAESTRNVQNGSSIFRSLISRARKTVLGSARDIGWLQGASAPVEDGTQRFTELLDSVRNGEHKLPNSMVYLLVPGLFSNHGPLYFVSTKTFFSKMGLACHIAKIHSEASVEKNARELKEYIEEVYWGSRKRIMVLGHSKGGVDAAAALSMYWSDLKDKVAGLALLQSPYGGSPIASDILREGQLGDYVQLRKLMEILICKVIKGDMQALEDLTYERRKEFLSKHQIPKELPVVSFHTEASIAPAVLATLSHVAHAELPLVSPLAAGQPTKVPVVMPLAAAMAACAQLLQIRYGEKSDGLVTRRDAEVPGSIVVRPERKLDHAWMVYSSLNDDPGEADASQVCEALLTLLVEVGQKRRHEIAMKDE